jgi:hypothetical protein
MTVTADDLDSALATVAAALAPATDRDWSARAGSLEWDCWHTAEHIGDVLLSYAAQLVARPATRYVRFLATVDKDATAAEALEFAVASGAVLGAAVRVAPAHVRAFHPTGMADPEGFAAMGCVEALVHGHDIAEGLGVPLTAPGDVCARVLTRLFPDLPAQPAEVDPWTALRWATGRADLPGLARPERWRWRGAPLAERD